MKRLYAIDGTLYDENGNVVKAKSLGYRYTFNFYPVALKQSVMDKTATEVVESDAPPLPGIDSYVLGTFQKKGNSCYCSVQYYILEK